MTPIDELIEFIETHGNGTSDRNKILTVNDIYEYAQALQLLQPDVIKSVCKCKEGKQGRTIDENLEQIFTRCGGY